MCVLGVQATEEIPGGLVTAYRFRVIPAHLGGLAEPFQAACLPMLGPGVTHLETREGLPQQRHAFGLLASAVQDVAEKGQDTGRLVCLPE